MGTDAQVEFVRMPFQSDGSEPFPYVKNIDRRAIVVFPGWTNKTEIILSPVQETLCRFGDVIGVQPLITFDNRLIASELHRELMLGRYHEAVLIGCSLGAMSAIDYYRRYCGNSAVIKVKLMLECGVISAADVRRDFRMLVKYGSRLPVLRGGMLLDRVYPKLAEWFFAHDKPIPLETDHNPILLDRHHQAMWNCPTRLSMSWLRALRTFAPLSTYELENIPASIIAYEDDQMVVPEAYQRQKTAAGFYCHPRLLPGYGHDDWVERPQQANQVLHEELGKLCQSNIPWPITD